MSISQSGEVSFPATFEWPTARVSNASSIGQLYFTNIISPFLEQAAMSSAIN